MSFASDQVCVGSDQVCVSFASDQVLQVTKCALVQSFLVLGFPDTHTVDYQPFIKSQPTRTQLTLRPYVVQIWSRHPPESGVNENIVVHPLNLSSKNRREQGRRLTLSATADANARIHNDGYKRCCHATISYAPNRSENEITSIVNGHAEASRTMEGSRSATLRIQSEKTCSNKRTVMPVFLIWP